MAAGGKAARARGRRGESAAKALLTGRDWVIHDLTAGLASGDLIGVDPAGRSWCIEVKATAAITTAHRKQAMEQGRKARLPWMLCSKIEGTSAWLVQRQGERPVVWTGADDADES